MLRFLLNALLALVAARFLFGLFRWMGDHAEESGRGARRDRGHAPGAATRGGATPGAATPGLDRSAVIDVTFTEVEPVAPAGSADGAAAGSADVAPAGSAAAGPDREAH